MRNLLVIICLIYSVALKAQVPQWQWARGGIDDSMEHTSGVSLFTTGKAVCVDAFNNVYVTGMFWDNMQMDTIALYGAGMRDVFLAKYDAAGNMKWVKRAGSILNDESVSVDTDPQGNIYIAGYFNDTAYFDTVRLVSRGGDDIFLAKYSPAGDVIWAKRAGSSTDDLVGGLHFDKKGYIYLTGNYAGTQQDSADFDTITVISKGAPGIFLAKYDTNGHIVWVKSEGGLNGGGGGAVTTDFSGNVFVTGGFSEPDCYFDSILFRTSATNYSDNNMFIAKFDSTGKILWANEAGGGDPGGGGVTAGAAVVVDASGNCYVTGLTACSYTMFSTTHTDGTIQVNSASLPGYTNVFSGYIARYNPAGKLLFAKNTNINTEDYNDVHSIVIDNNNNLYLAGEFEGHSYIKDTVTSYGSYDAFVAKYDSAGNGEWLVHGGGVSSDCASGLAIDNGGSLYTTGYCNNNYSAFGSCYINGGVENVFVAKLSSATNVPVIPAYNSNFSVYPNPANSYVSIGLNGSLITDVAITDCYGQNLYTQRVFGQKNIGINTSAFTEGVYFIIVKSTAGNATKKLIIQH